MRRIYIKDKDALILVLQAIGFLFGLISIIAFVILYWKYGFDKAEEIFDEILWVILCGIGVIIVVAAHIFLVVLTGATIYAICSVSRDAIGFRSKEETKIASYNERVEKVAKSVSDDIHKKAGKYSYENEVFQEDVIKRLGKMVKDQSSSQEEE